MDYCDCPCHRTCGCNCDFCELIHPDLEWYDLAPPPDWLEDHNTQELEQIEDRPGQPLNGHILPQPTLMQEDLCPVLDDVHLQEPDHSGPSQPQPTWMHDESDLSGHSQPQPTWMPDEPHLSGLGQPQSTLMAESPYPFKSHLE